MAIKTTMTYKCDRCGKETEMPARYAGTTFYLKCLRKKIILGKGSWSTDIEYDLCDECASEFRFDFMKGAKPWLT